MEIRKIIGFVFIAHWLLISCKTGVPEEVPPGQAGDSNEIFLTKVQIMEAGIETSLLTRRVISENITCTGTIEADPNQKAQVSPAIKGYVQSVLVHPGDYVRKWQALARLTHPDYIRLQQEFLETKSQYEYFKEDFKRQGELSLENAASLKTMQLAQNEFRKTEARLFALKKYLSFLGIDADSLEVENLQPDILLRAPVDGYITDINAQIGMLCTEETPVFRIVGTKNLMLHLSAFGKDMTELRVGQIINFSVPSGAGHTYKARIKAIARAADVSDKFGIHAHIENNAGDLLPGMFVHAKIQTAPDSVWSVPEVALVIHNDQEYLFRKTSETHFEPVEITSGVTENGWTEILDFPPGLTGKEIVTKGAYYIHSEWMKEE
jgi:cobalt-zinc-cadmium efflux system membrane fusion protein